MVEPTRHYRLLYRVVWVGIIGLSLLLGWLGSIGVTNSREHRTKYSRAENDCKSLALAVEAYVKNEANTKHELPNTLHDLVKPPFGGSTFLSNGEEELIDQWGKPFEMERFRRSNGTESILVKTTAPDGTPISQHGIGPNARPQP